MIWEADHLYHIQEPLSKPSPRRRLSFKTVDLNGHSRRLNRGVQRQQVGPAKHPDFRHLLAFSRTGKYHPRPPL
jgi:hypothetical protein